LTHDNAPDQAMPIEIAILGGDSQINILSGIELDTFGHVEYKSFW